MPYTKVLIHFIWSTKNRQHLITNDLKPLLLNHIKENSIKKGIFIDTLNCVSDHIHLLVSLGSEQTIAKSAMLIKGESSFWVNRQNILRQKFEWQDEYETFCQQAWYTNPSRIPYRMRCGCQQILSLNV